MPDPKITKLRAELFFETLDANEEIMSEGAALAVTLTQFGYKDHELDIIAEMADALEDDL